MKTIWLTLAAALAIVIGPPAHAQKSANTLRWVSAYPIDAIDPYYNVSREMVVITSQEVWDTLIWRDPSSGAYRPLLATSWKWVNPTTIEFTLRPDVHWQDGRPLTATDAVYTFNYIGNAGHKIPMVTNVNWVKGAEQIDPHRFRLFLKAPFPPALEYLSSVLPVLPAAFYGSNGKAPPVGKAVGTGPYRITRFTPSQDMDVELTGQYFAGSPKGQPTIKRIEYRRIPDESTQLAELLSHGTDWIWNVPSDQATRLGKATGVTVKSTETMRFSLIQFNLRNMAKPNPLQKLQVRQAIAYAIDRQGIINNMIGYGAEVPKAFCYKTMFGCDEDVTQYSYDPELAKKLLTEGGYPHGLTLELQAFRNRDWTDAVGGYLQAVGIRTKIDFLPYAADQQRLAQDQEQLYLQDNGWFSINDLFAVVNQYFSMDKYDSTHDAQLTQWVQAAAETNDAATRKTLYAKVLKRIADQVYMLPMWTHPNIHAFSSDLAFTPYFDENPRFYLAHWKH